MTLAQTLKKAKEDRAKLFGDALAIINKADEEKRALTDDENKKVDELNTQATAMDASIEQLQRNLDIQTRAAGAGIQQGPTDKENEEIRKFDFGKFAKEARNGGASGLTGLEKEMHQEAELEAKQSGVALRGIGIPRKALDVMVESRDMNYGTATAGGNTVQLEKVGFFEGLFNRLVFAGMGAEYLNGLTGDVDYPGMNANASVVWASTENATSTETSPTTRVVQLRAKRLTAFIDMSNQLLAQNPNVIQAAVIRNLMNAVAVAVEAAGINGSGSSGQPTGILNTSGIGSVAGGTNGAAPTIAHLIDLETAIETANATGPNMRYLTNGKVRGKLKKTVLDAGSGLMTWPLIGAPEINSYGAVVTNNVPSTLTKGTADSVCSAILFGNFEDLIIANWGGLDVMVNPYTRAKDAITELIVNSYWDIGVRRAESFAAMKDALTT